MITLILATILCLVGAVNVVRHPEKLEWIDTATVYLFYITIGSTIWEVYQWSQNMT